MSAIFFELIYEIVWPLAYVWVIDNVSNQYKKTMSEISSKETKRPWEFFGPHGLVVGPGL